ncbi:hypothetical protein EDB89DRAFT_340249 [Lactarius sanguifluus]|nr:hypothetical protein EDB89DRAFT_340249 [Lactarius sanguifluus]
MRFSANKSNLFPILPSTIGESRYRATMGRVSPTITPFGINLVSACVGFTFEFVAFIEFEDHLFGRPSYQSQGWTISAHPEGKRYAHMRAPVGLTVVTEARIVEPEFLDQLDAWLVLISNLIADEHVHLPETSHLFLEIHQDSGTCNYYFADHHIRTIFWLHTLDTISVGLPHSYSNGHLQCSLQENYWTHVGLFPETASRYSSAALNELQVIFLRARVDALTSEAPTFPYTGEQIVEFIDLLQHSKDHVSSPCVTTYVARLWATIVNHRFIIRFGEARGQLSLDQSMSEVADSKPSLALTMISKALLFGFPDVHRARFEALWIDQVVYTSPWRKHISGTVEDLKQKMTWIFTLLGLNIAMMSIPAPHALNKASLLLCFLGLAVAFFLSQEQQNLVDTDATTAAMYLDDRNTSYGFQPISIVHSLPQALFTWAFLLLAIQCLWMTFADLPSHLLLSTLVPVGAVLVVMCAFLWRALRPRQKPSRTPC